MSWIGKVSVSQSAGATFLLLLLGTLCFFSVPSLLAVCVCIVQVGTNNKSSSSSSHTNVIRPNLICSLQWQSCLLLLLCVLSIEDAEEEGEEEEMEYEELREYRRPFL